MVNIEEKQGLEFENIREKEDYKKKLIVLFKSSHE